MTHTPLDLDEIAARAEATRPGPWALYDDLEGDGYPGHLWVVRTPDSGPDEPDDQAVVISIGDRALGEFIAHAREDVPALLAEVRRLRDELAASRAQAWRDLADRANPAHEASWFGDFGHMVGGWIRQQAEYEARAARPAAVAAAGNTAGTNA